MKNQTSLSSLAILIIIMSACSASKKFDFADAYKFSHYHHQATEQEKPELVEDQVLTVSASENVAIKEKAIETTIENEKIRPIKTWTKEEKKELKKEIKQELKRIRSEVKEYKKGNISTPPEMQSTKATQGIDGKVYIGAVIGAAGLVLLILGVASAVGGLAVVVGLVFIVWGLIEQGSI